MAIMDILVLLVHGPQRREALAAFAPVQRQLLAVAQILQRKSEQERKYLDRLEGVSVWGVPDGTVTRRMSYKQPSRWLRPCVMTCCCAVASQVRRGRMCPRGRLPSS